MLADGFLSEFDFLYNIRWTQEWTEPHRLLKRRLLTPPKEAEVLF